MTCKFQDISYVFTCKNVITKTLTDGLCSLWLFIFLFIINFNTEAYSYLRSPKSGKPKTSFGEEERRTRSTAGTLASY